MISLDFMNSSTLHNSTDLLQPFKTMTFLQPLNAVSYSRRHAPCMHVILCILIFGHNSKRTSHFHITHPQFNLNRLLNVESWHAERKKKKNQCSQQCKQLIIANGSGGRECKHNLLRWNSTVPHYRQESGGRTLPKAKLDHLYAKRKQKLVSI